MLGSDHALKIGGYWRDSNTTSITHMGGFATVRFPTAETNDCSVASAGCHVDVSRDGYSVYDLKNYAAYVDFLVKNGVLKQGIPAADLITNDLIDDINKFDAKEIETMAKGWKG